MKYCGELIGKVIGWYSPPDFILIASAGFQLMPVIFCSTCYNRLSVSSFSGELSIRAKDLPDSLKIRPQPQDLQEEAIQREIFQNGWREE